MGSVPWIVATMMYDSYEDATVLHCHVVGGPVEQIRAWRDPRWPMVDLWARVPADRAADPWGAEGAPPISHARVVRRGAGGW